MHAITALSMRARRAQPVRRVALLAASLAVSALAACGGGSDATGPEATGRGTVRLSNVSNLSAYYVYIKSCSASSWGPDRMGEGVLSVGESATIGLDTGCYDLRAETSHANNMRYEQRGLQLTSGQTLQINISGWSAQ